MKISGAGFSQQPAGRSRQGPDAGGRYDYLLLTVQGEALLWQERVEMTIRAGGLTLLPPADAMHGWRVTSLEPWKAHWLRWELSAAERAQLAYPAAENGVVHLEAPSPLHAQLIPLLSRITSLQPHAITSAGALIERLGQVLLEEIRFFYGPARTPNDPPIAAALAAIDRHLGDPNLSLAELVECSGLGRTTFATRFTESMQMAPMRYVEEQRLTLARQRLESGDVQVNEVAYDVGYSDPRYFGRRFLKRFKITPGALAKAASCKANRQPSASM